MMRHVDVPEEIARELVKVWSRSAGKDDKRRSPKHIPVIATVHTKSHRTTLVPAGAGRYRMNLHSELRNAAQADTGDLIGVSLRYDTESREIEAPRELRAVLQQHPKAYKELQRLPPGHKRQLLLFYLRAKSAKAREHAAEKILDHLLERAILEKGMRGRRKSHSD